MAKKSKKPQDAQPEAAAKTSEATPKARKSPAKKTSETPAGSEAGAAKPKKSTKPRKARMTIKSESGEELEIQVPVGGPFQHPGDDPVGDVTDGEGQFSAPLELESPVDAGSQSAAEMTAYRADASDAAIDGTLELAPAAEVAESGLRPGQAMPQEEETAPVGEPAKLDRLQKILSQAGIASRRRAEELITEGRVQVNGQVITQLGAKADPARDHIRVDGKLISGAERRRYFVLNKPKGYVTTVSDPEGRPTVMQFFVRMSERLYPVGRLDYQSEGLLLVTNDGELANQLTRAASGVEKTYLVKVAGQPTEEQIEQLRSGVAIDREEPGSGKVHTAPAQIRQVRRGDNPWFEVVLIEGRNRELRKMFSAIGHFVEKIRRVGYGPLVLDLEPGKFRELRPEELAALRLAAEGKLKPRRPRAAKMLPKGVGQRPEQRTFKPAARGARPFREAGGHREKKDWQPREPRFGGRAERQRGTKPGFGRPQGERAREKPRFERQDPGERSRRHAGGGGFGFRLQQPRDRDAEPRFEQGADRGARRHSEQPHFKRLGFRKAEEPPRRFDKRPSRNFGASDRGEPAARPSGRFDKSAGGEGRNSRRVRDWDKERQGPARLPGGLKPPFGGKGKSHAGRSKPSFGAKHGFKRPGGRSGD